MKNKPKNIHDDIKKPSNKDSKLLAREKYHKEYDGVRWMGSGVKPPVKGGHGRGIKT